MGATISSIFSRFFGKTPFRIIMLGLDGVGKTTILYQLKLGEVLTTIPTIGFNIETVEHKNINFTIWDFCASGNKMQPFIRHYFESTNGLIFVIDSNDHERIAEATNELHNILNSEELKDVIVLILANKQDIPSAMTKLELEEKLRLKEFKNLTWFVQSACALEGTGLFEGLDWLSSELSKK